MADEKIYQKWVAEQRKTPHEKRLDEFRLQEIYDELAKDEPDGIFWVKHKPEYGDYDGNPARRLHFGNFQYKVFDRFNKEVWVYKEDFDKIKAMPDGYEFNINDGTVRKSKELLIKENLDKLKSIEDVPNL